MERYKCKLCLKCFSNGRALGGHMRSHMLNLPLPLPPKPDEKSNQIINEELESGSSKSLSEDEEEKSLSYGLRENPKKSVRLVDPEFSFNAGSIVVQDRESETESSKNPTRRRSKRTRKMSKSESWIETEPASSISNATTEEDVAFCLMMLSRDKWSKKHKHEHEEQEDDEMDELYEVKFSKCGVKYKCDTCKKVFQSYQALGGHRASHKKIKLSNPIKEIQSNNAGTSSNNKSKIYECPVCFRVFASGQALGGHKRSHGSDAAAATPVISLTKYDDNWIDLNLPAQADMDDDEFSQIEISAVSDDEFGNHIKR